MWEGPTKAKDPEHDGTWLSRDRKPNCKISDGSGDLCYVVIGPRVKKMRT